MIYLIQLIHMLTRLFTLIVVIDVLLSYFMSPYHPVREMMDRILAPLINPIRRVVPPAGMFDFSPLILIVLAQVIDFILTAMLSSIG
jgi:YggT family protein